MFTATSAPVLPEGQCFVLLNSDFVDGSCLALGEFTDQDNLMSYMAKADGALWKKQQSVQRLQGKTTRRVNVGQLWFCSTQEQVNDLHLYLDSDLGSSEEQEALQRLTDSGCKPQCHIGDYQERAAVFGNAAGPNRAERRGNKKRLRVRKGFS